MRWRARREEPAVEEVGETSGWVTVSSGALSLGVTAVRWGAWGLLLSGTPLALVALTAGTAEPVVVPVQEERGEGVGDSGPAGFASLVVDTYVSALAEDADGQSVKALKGLVPSASDQRMGSGQGVGAVRAESSSAVRVESVAAGYWSVTVAARVLEEAPVDEGGKDEEVGAQVRYFQVPVRQVRGGALVAVSLPAEVAAAAGGRGQESGLGYGTVQQAMRTAPLVKTLDAVFGAYLAGRGDLDRYMSPGARLSAVEPAPYAVVAVERLAEVGTNEPLVKEQSAAPADGERRELLVEVEATSRSGAVWPLSYALELVARDGRWEVAVLKAAPALKSSGNQKEAQR